MAVATGGADHTDDVQHHVLGGDAGAELAFHAHLHVLHFLRHQGLGGEHMLHFTGADAVGETDQGAVGGHRRAGPPRLTTGQAQPREGLRRGHFVDDLTINVNQRGAVLAFGHEVGVPQLVVECLACHNLFSN